LARPELRNDFKEEADATLISPKNSSGRTGCDSRTKNIVAMVEGKFYRGGEGQEAKGDDAGVVAIKQKLGGPEAAGNRREVSACLLNYTRAADVGGLGNL